MFGTNQKIEDMTEQLDRLAAEVEALESKICSLTVLQDKLVEHLVNLNPMVNEIHHNLKRVLIHFYLDDGAQAKMSAFERQEKEDEDE